MGGVPALGGMALPMATVAQRKSLIVTESPASQEMVRNHFVRLSSTSSAAAQQIAQMSRAHATQGRSDSTSLESAAGNEPAWKVLPHKLFKMVVLRSTSKSIYDLTFTVGWFYFLVPMSVVI
jgi:hypothetical protein